MRIAMISEHASPLVVLGGEDAGGQNVHVAELARSLAGRGHRVDVYTRRDRPHAPRTVTPWPGVQVVHVPAGPPRRLPKDELLPHMPRFGAVLAAHWLRRPPDVAHAHFWMSGLAAVLAAGVVPVPVVQTFHALGSVKRRHQGEADTSPVQRIGLESRLARGCDAVIATCDEEVRELTRLGADPAAVHVVPCGVDLSAFHPADGHPDNRGPVPDSPGTLPPRRARYRLLSLGRLVPRKDIDGVIAALAQVPDTELLVAGGPDPDRLDADPDCRRLRAAARAQGVADRVLLLGRIGRASAPDLIRSSDLVVSVPWYEPFGIVPIEAMACGVPVVASAVGGMQDTVLPGRTGLHVPPRDPPALAVALNRLLADPDRRAELGRRAAEHAATRYGWDRVARCTDEVLHLVRGQWRQRQQRQRQQRIGWAGPRPERAAG